MCKMPFCYKFCPESIGETAHIAAVAKWVLGLPNREDDEIDLDTNLVIT